MTFGKPVYARLLDLNLKTDLLVLGAGVCLFSQKMPCSCPKMFHLLTCRQQGPGVPVAPLPGQHLVVSVFFPLVSGLWSGSLREESWQQMLAMFLSLLPRGARVLGS